MVCPFNRLLGNTYRSEGESEKAVHYYRVALEMETPFNWHDPLFWIHSSLAALFSDEGEFYNTAAHIERAKSHAVKDVEY